MMMMMVAMTSARTTRTSAINIKKNAMRNITNRNAQRPVANVEEMMVVMMVVMTLVMMVSARICGMQRNAKSQRKIAKRMTTLPKIANKHADCAMMMVMMVMMVAMMDVKNWRNTDARHARCWSAANARC